MKTEDILNILSDININSETAVEAVELYVKFMYFEKLLNCLTSLCLASVTIAFIWFCVNLLKEVSE